jgi:hypothetical protein
LNISGHGSPRGDCTAQCVICTQGFSPNQKTSVIHRFSASKVDFGSLPDPL